MTRYYIVSCSEALKDEVIPGSAKFKVEEFKDLAEKLGTVYEDNFQDAFNEELINSSTDYLYIENKIK